MASKRSAKTTTSLILVFVIAICTFVPVFASPPSPLSHHHGNRSQPKKDVSRKFEISNDMFWKDGNPFQIIGGDLHYFRVIPEYWEDRLLKAKALGLNTIQTYVPWNLHEPKPGKLDFEGIANIEAFLKLCHKLGLLVMLRAGPYICAEWDLGGFPSWLLAMDPSPKLRSSDPTFLQLVDGWWSTLLPKLVPLLFDNGGPIIMVQIENEFGSYGNDQAYLHHLVNLARDHLGHDVILYTTDSKDHLERGTIRGDAVFSAVDFSTGDDPWPIFKLQKEFNAPGKSPPLSAEFYTGWLTHCGESIAATDAGFTAAALESNGVEFYTGWLTHWGERIAATDADFTAAALNKILQKNGSAVLYMAHGGTNFGFYNGANTGQDEADYKADITSYDYDAPIRESGDVNNAKFNALRKVIAQYSSAHLPSVPSDNGKAGYGPIQLQKKAFLFDMVDLANPSEVIESENPLSMESVGQMFGFLLYMSKYTSKGGGSNLFIPKVHDRAQVFILCPSKESGARPTYVGTLERRLNNKQLNNLVLPETECFSDINLYILVENMGHLNYGAFIFDRKGILSSVYLDGETLHGWKMLPIPFHNLNEFPTLNPIAQSAFSTFSRMSMLRKKLIYKSGEDQENTSQAPAIYSGHFSIDKSELIKDTFISFNNWGKGIAFVNEFNLGRYWPLRGPQCNLYVPAPLLKQGDNTLVIFELESPNPALVVHSVNEPDFTCGSALKSEERIMGPKLT